MVVNGSMYLCACIINKLTMISHGCCVLLMHLLTVPIIIVTNIAMHE